MLEEGALGRGRRGSRTPECGGNSSNQSPQPASRWKKRKTERRRSRTLGRRQRALAAGLMFTSSEYARTRRSSRAALPSQAAFAASRRRSRRRATLRRLFLRDATIGRTR
jgi:hypothetical protein